MPIDESAVGDSLPVCWQSETGVRREAERTEIQFELLVDSVEEYAICLLDREGRVQTWNGGAERLTGYTSEEIVGEHVSVFHSEGDVEAGIPDRLLHAAVVEGRVRDEGWRVRKDGSEFWADVTITALREEGDLAGYAVVIHDSTRRRREATLLEQNEQLKDHIAAISHDLHGPLAVAAGNAELALETGDLSRLEVVSRAHDRAVELLDHLQTMAKEGTRILNAEPVELCEVAEGAWSVVETDGAELVVEGDGALVADRQRLQQLLENLFRNAVEHAGPDVTVAVGLLEEGGFYVEDDGSGIPETEQTEVFEMGYSADAEGAGFGLAICKQIADAHGWLIDVGEGADGGARFEVRAVDRT
jgi:PAS domain S-box-containing protein